MHRTRPGKRKFAKPLVEFGAKLDISVVNGWAHLEVYNFDAYNEVGGLAEMIERYHARTKRYPSRVLADKIYRNRSNIAYCKERSIRLSGPAPGRPPKDVQPDKKQNYIDECERVEVERRFSVATRVCGLDLITVRLKETACHCIAVFNEKIGVCSIDITIKFFVLRCNLASITVSNDTKTTFYAPFVPIVCATRIKKQTFMTHAYPKVVYKSDFVVNIDKFLSERLAVNTKCFFAK